LFLLRVQTSPERFVELCKLFAHSSSSSLFSRTRQGGGSGEEAAQGSVLAENLNRRLEDHVIQRRMLQQQQEEEMMTASRTVPPPPAQEATRAPLRNVQLDDELDSDFDDNDDDDDDPILSEIRERRMQEIKLARQLHNQNLSRGHGEVRTLSQDEFLPECLQQGTAATSRYVAVHFFHGDFERCKIMDHHLRAVAARHVSCKFLRIDAERAPFFVQRLSVRTLPTLLVFEKGQVVDRLVGFEGLVSPKASDPDQWKTSQLQQWLARTGAIDYDATKRGNDSDTDDDDDNDDEDQKKASRGIQRMNIRHQRSRQDDD
jgi:thiol-disulfide isomerase/thioredoxin